MFIETDGIMSYLRRSQIKDLLWAFLNSCKSDEASEAKLKVCTRNIETMLQTEGA